MVNDRKERLPFKPMYRRDGGVLEEGEDKDLLISWEILLEVLDVSKEKECVPRVAQRS